MCIVTWCQVSEVDRGEEMPLSIQKRNRMICLFDCYSSLLTEKQTELFKYYFYEDLSLAEISELCHISRQAVHNSLGRCEEILETYEQQLKILERTERYEMLFNDVIETIEDSLKTGKWEEKVYVDTLERLQEARKADVDGT